MIIVRFPDGQIDWVVEESFAVNTVFYYGNYVFGFCLENKDLDATDTFPEDYFTITGGISIVTAK